MATPVLREWPTTKLIPTKHRGVYQREGEDRKYDGKPDHCFYISYKQPDSKKVWEKIGWRSENMTAALASNIRADRMQQLRLGAAAVPVQQRRKEPDMTFGEAWALFDKKWLPNLKRPDTERHFYTLYLEPVLKDRPLKDITPLELEDLKTSLLARGLAAVNVVQNIFATGKAKEKEKLSMTALAEKK